MVRQAMCAQHVRNILPEDTALRDTTKDTLGDAEFVPYIDYMAGRNSANTWQAILRGIEAIKDTLHRIVTIRVISVAELLRTLGLRTGRILRERSLSS